MHRRFEASQQGAKKPAVNPIREGFRTLSPYLVARDAAGLIDFVKQVFDAEEKFRAIGHAGGIHCEVRLGDSMMMIGGGGPGALLERRRPTHGVSRLRARHGRHIPARARCGEHVLAGAGRSAVGRAHGQREGPARQPLVHRDLPRRELLFAGRAHRAALYASAARGAGGPVPEARFRSQGDGAVHGARRGGPSQHGEDRRQRAGDGRGPGAVPADARHVLSVRARCGRHVPPRARSRRGFHQRAGRPVVWRPHRRRQGYLRQPVVPRHARGTGFAGRR